jgi:hypothetical protein
MVKVYGLAKGREPMRRSTWKPTRGGLGDGARVLDTARRRCAPAFRVPLVRGGKAPPLDIVGGSGAYLKVRVNGVVGWTNDI